MPGPLRRKTSLQCPHLPHPGEGRGSGATRLHIHAPSTVPGTRHVGFTSGVGQVALQRREAEQRAGSEQEAIQALQRQQEERMAAQQATIAQLWELRAALSRAQVRLPAPALSRPVHVIDGTFLDALKSCDFGFTSHKSSATSLGGVTITLS